MSACFVLVTRQTADRAYLIESGFLGRDERPDLLHPGRATAARYFDASTALVAARRWLDYWNDLDDYDLTARVLVGPRLVHEFKQGPSRIVLDVDSCTKTVQQWGSGLVTTRTKCKICTQPVSPAGLCLSCELAGTKSQIETNTVFASPC